MNTIIEVKNLTKKYGDFTAVGDISFTVNAGETFGILGPNGAGKTTTLEMIEGLKDITGGTVLVSGLDVTTQKRGVKEIIGVQLQSSTFFDGLDLAELLRTFASMYGRKVDAAGLLELVQLTEKAKSKVKELSGGQKQRLSIAVALVNDPKVIFLDEPTTGLDPQARRNLWDLVKHIKSRGTTIVLTTHYMEEAETLCDRVAIMDSAKIIALDTTSNLIRQSGIHSVVAFRSQTCGLEHLRGLPQIGDASVVDGTFRVTTDDPQGVLTVVLQHAKACGPIHELALHDPTLEDVFLKLTGHALRE